MFQNYSRASKILSIYNRLILYRTSLQKYSRAIGSIDSPKDQGSKIAAECLKVSPYRISEFSIGPISQNHTRAIKSIRSSTKPMLRTCRNCRINSSLLEVRSQQDQCLQTIKRLRDSLQTELIVVSTKLEYFLTR